MTCLRCGAPCDVRLVRVRREVALALYGLGLGLAYVLGGQLLHDLMEGMRRDLLPLWKAWVPGAVLLLAVTASVARRRRPVCGDCGPAGWLAVIGPASPAAGGTGATRRAVLRGLGATAAVLAATVGGFAAAVARNRAWMRVGREIAFPAVEKTAPHARVEWTGARIRSYRRLGRTGAMVSDVSLGSSRIQDVEVARRALERGVTYFDTAPDYADTGSEQLLGEAMRGRRDAVFLATKFCVASGHLPNDTPVPEIMAAVEGSLRRLRTDYVDLVHIHSCDRLDRLMAPNIHEAFDRLKAQGKARFLGVSTHTPNLEAVANAAIDSGRFDVLMLAYHFGMYPGFAHVLEKAKAHDVGVVAMKTLKGARHADLAGFRDEATAYSQAAFRWVLSNPNVSCLVVSFFASQHVDEYLHASGTALQPADVTLLRRYDALIAGDYCQPHCGVCLDSCPYDLPINDVLRYRMYARDYGWAGEGRRRYAALEQDAAACLGCAAPCAGTCPIDVPIREKMLDAHRILRTVA